jgi:hypothetical protein
MAGVFVRRALEKALENAGKKTEKRTSTTKRPRAPKRKRK